ncbi:MAG TPA: hypothetical protein VGK48_12190 [Terriglobia bacterium]
MAALSAFLLGSASGFASPTYIAPGGVSYKTTLGIDLDGDHIPETATIRQQGSFYQVSIHFSTGRPKLKLRTFVGDDVAGLTIEITDINSDSEADLVISSATSTRPIAVWLNRGSANFQRVNVRAYGFYGRFTGPRWREKPGNHRAPAGSLSNDRLLQAELGDSFSFSPDLQDLVSSQTHPSAYQFWLVEVAPRGPPSAPHV